MADLKSQWRAAEKLFLPKTAPAGRSTYATARHIYQTLDKQETKGVFMVEGWRFGSKERHCQALEIREGPDPRIKWPLARAAKGKESLEPMTVGRIGDNMAMTPLIRQRPLFRRASLLAQMIYN